MKTLSTAILTILLVAASFGGAVADMARLQVIHNSPDPLAASVDVYVNGDKTLPNFAFRTATPFLDLPSGVPLEIALAPAGSGSVGDAVATFPAVTLAAHQTYVAIAGGVVNPGDFNANPELRPISLKLFATDGVRTKARWSWFTDLLIFHGAPDAPAVNVGVRGWEWGNLVNDLGYGEFSRYRTVLPWVYTLEVAPAAAPETVVAAFQADLRGLRGGAAIVFASGFLDPAANQNGPGFGLFAALPNGDVIELPALQSNAKLQVIHNSPDPAAAVVDVYVEGNLFIDDLAFRSADSLRTVPAGVPLQVGIAPGNSASAADTIPGLGSVFTLNQGESYVAVASGVLVPGDYKANPNGESIAFAIFPRDGIGSKSFFDFGTRVVAFHGSTDAPAVDIYARRYSERTKLFGNLTYGDFSDTRRLRPRKYLLDVTPAGDKNTVVATFEADLNGLGGGSAVVFASGFFSVAENNGGPGFGLYAALPSGAVIMLPPVGVAYKFESERQEGTKPLEFGMGQNYPNPFNPSTSIAFSLSEAADVRLDVFNVLGQQVRTLVDGRLEAGPHEVAFDGSKLASGMYFYRLEAGENTVTRKMTLMK